MSARSLRSPHRAARKSSKNFKRLLRSEPLEPRALLSGNSLLYSLLGHIPPAPAATAWVAATVKNAAPTLAQSIAVNNGSPVTGRTASLSVLGRDDAGESKLIYKWSVSAAPSGGTAAFSLNNTNAAKSSTVTFSKAGNYTLAVKITDAGGLSVSATKKVSVITTAAAISVRTASGAAVNAGSTFAISGVSQAFAAQEVDQFGYSLASQPTLTWSATAIPVGATAPAFNTTQGVTSVTFSAAGYYNLVVRASNNSAISTVFTVQVKQVLSSIILSPNAPSVSLGGTQQFAAQGFDQFGKALSTQPTFTWSTNKGTITTAGLFTAPSAGTSCTVTAKSGSLSQTATVQLLANSNGYQNAALGSLVTSLDADGSINRTDMIQILRSAGNDGTVDAGEFADMKTILTKAAALNIPEYVQVLAGDVINGNLANATYQSQSLGNLAAGDSAAKMNKLIDKWFLGADHPVVCNSSASYKAASGALFAHTPSHTDELQGQLGDCYFISALGTLADSNPAAVQNMFLDNGDGTYTVRFYTGNYGTIYNYADGSIGAGFKDSNISVDYVTVDRMLPASSSGVLIYANYGKNVSDAASSLWIPLAEKAYAQWNQTGKEGRDGTNAYASIQGGWMATVDAQVLGHNAIDYIMTSTKEQVAINALAAHKAVTIGTLQFSTDTKYGLYGTHAYAIIGYNASTDRFTLYNPWGSYQPGPLSWSQLQEACSQMAVADTTGTSAFKGVAAAAVSVHASLAEIRSDGVAAVPTFRFVDEFFRLDLTETPKSRPILSSVPSALLSDSAPVIHARPDGIDKIGSIRSLTDATFSDNHFVSENLPTEISLDWAPEPVAA
jgi:hypothetical protein